MYWVVFELFVLYENDVLDFDKMVVIFFWWIGRFFLDVVVMVKENFGVRFVWIGWFYLLEVIWGCDMDDVIFRNIVFFLNFKCFVIGVINGG